MTLLKVSLDDKFTKEDGRIYLNGTQALVRLTLMQRRRDLAAGLNTAGYVTGYRGSPLGGMDKEFYDRFQDCVSHMEKLKDNGQHILHSVFKIFDDLHSYF